MRVPGLVDLVGGVGINLIGDKPWHPSNHWGTVATIQAVRDLARAYYLEYQEDLDINDISLRDGGVFDLNRNWRPPDHSIHREGKNVDVRSKYMDQDQKDYFRLAADNVGFDAVLEEDPEHWHLTKR